MEEFDAAAYLRKCIKVGAIGGVAIVVAGIVATLVLA